MSLSMDILKRIAHEHKVSPDYILQKSSKRDIVNLRYLVAHELKEKHNYKLTMIARFFGNDHTNIISLLRRGWVESKRSPSAMMPCYKCEKMVSRRCLNGC